MKIRSKLVLVILILGAFTLAAPALADSHGKPEAADAAEPGSKGKKEPGAEERAAMADAHQRMAECLRSDRPMKDCRGEMKKAHATFGHGMRCTHGDSCPHGEDCDGSCEHHGRSGGKHGGKHGAGGPGAKGEADESPKALPEGKPKK